LIFTMDRLQKDTIAASANLKVRGRWVEAEGKREADRVLRGTKLWAGKLKVGAQVANEEGENRRFISELAFFWKNPLR